VQFLTVRPVFSFEHYFPKLLYEAAKQAHQAHFSDATLPNKSTIFQLGNRFDKVGATNYKRRGSVLEAYRTPCWKRIKFR
jgi:hypothetical protein